MLDLPTFRHTRTWWPVDLLDESMPPGRSEPQAWLEPNEAGITLIHADDDDEKTVVARIEPGTVVKFLWHETRGSVEITLMPDGTWHLDDPRDAFTLDLFKPEAEAMAAPVTLPPSALIAAANWFAWDEDYETNMDTMDEFVRAFAELAQPIDADGQRMTIDMGYWSDSVPFRVSADGKALVAA